MLVTELSNKRPKAIKVAALDIPTTLDSLEVNRDKSSGPYFKAIKPKLAISANLQVAGKSKSLPATKRSWLRSK